jgi:hypothetical protein
MVDLWGPGAFGAAGAAAVRPPFSPNNGAGDPDDWFQDCSGPAVGDGTEWRAANVNALLAQMRSVARKSGCPVSNLDDDLLTAAIRGQGANYRSAGGTANALTVSLDPVPVSFGATAGLVLRIVTSATNPGPATLDIGVGGNVAIVNLNTGAALRGGEIPPLAVVISDGTVWRLKNPTAESTIRDALFPYVSILNSANFSSGAGVETGFTNWGAPVGNPDVAAGFNPANSQFTVPPGMGGLWYFRAYANSVTSGNTPAAGHGVRLRQNGTLINAGSSPASSIIQCTAVATVPAAAGDVIQMLNLANNAGMGLSYFFFTAVRFGRIS